MLVRLRLAVSFVIAKLLGQGRGWGKLGVTQSILSSGCRLGLWPLWVSASRLITMRSVTAEIMLQRNVLMLWRSSYSDPVSACSRRVATSHT